VGVDFVQDGSVVIVPAGDVRGGRHLWPEMAAVGAPPGNFGRVQLIDGARAYAVHDETIRGARFGADHGHGGGAPETIVDGTFASDLAAPYAFRGTVRALFAVAGEMAQLTLTHGNGTNATRRIVQLIAGAGLTTVRVRDGVGLVDLGSFAYGGSYVSCVVELLFGGGGSALTGGQAGGVLLAGLASDTTVGFPWARSVGSVAWEWYYNATGTAANRARWDVRDWGYARLSG
jgi:hypothetical protein